MAIAESALLQRLGFDHASKQKSTESSEAILKTEALVTLAHKFSFEYSSDGKKMLVSPSISPAEMRQATDFILSTLHGDLPSLAHRSELLNRFGLNTFELLKFTLLARNTDSPLIRHFRLFGRNFVETKPGHEKLSASLLFLEQQINLINRRAQAGTKALTQPVGAVDEDGNLRRTGIHHD